MAFEMALFGTGIIKGPFAIEKEYPRWTQAADQTEATPDDAAPTQGTYDPIIKTVPKVTSVSVWNFYPDPDASQYPECEGVIERHKLSLS
jgi:hypothetical protein